MYYSTGFSENIQNISVLVNSVQPNFPPSDQQSLKIGLYQYIEKYQPVALLAGRRPMELMKVDDPQEIRSLAQVFQEKSKLNDLNQSTMIDLSQSHSVPGADEHIKAALNLIRVKDPYLHALIHLVFNYYFLAPSPKAGGGSSSGGIGVLWLNPRQNWTVQDYAEMIVHEMTHQLLFIDERRYGHYSRYDLMADPKFFAYSSILNKSRPLDKVVHSLFVALNVLEFRKNFFGLDSTPVLHPGSSKIKESLHSTLESLKDLQKTMFEPRLNKLIKDAQSMLLQLKG